ncbi:MAG: discoidin domain-containing protein [Pseudomonadales bacterium]
MFEKIQQVTTSVHRQWSAIGPGVPLGKANLEMAQILSAADANCSQQSYLTSRLLLLENLPAVRIGLWAHDGSNDLMVQTRVGERDILIVPSDGIAFEDHWSELLRNPEKASSPWFTDNPSATPNYAKPSFFSKVERIDIYPTLDNAEFNHTLTATIEGQNLFEGEHGPSAARGGGYLAGLSGKFPQTIELKWSDPTDLYRVSIRWYSDDDYASRYKVMALIGEEWKLIKEVSGSEHRKADVSTFAFQPVRARRIKFEFTETSGQDRILVRSLGVY